MSLLKSFVKATNAAESVERDSLGGGYILPSNIYMLTVETAFLQPATSGAVGVVLRFKTQEGNKDYRETIYITNKQGETFYTKDGQQHLLPGYLMVDTLCQMITGNSLENQNTELRSIKVYDPELQKEVPAEREVLVDLQGGQVYAGIIKSIEDKTKKNDSFDPSRPKQGTNLPYLATGETREANSISKFFHSESKQTLAEAIAGTDAKFFDDWLAKFKDQVVNNAKGAATGAVPGKVPATPANAPAPTTGGLFAKKTS